MLKRKSHSKTKEIAFISNSTIQSKQNKFKLKTNINIQKQNKNKMKKNQNKYSKIMSLP